MYVYLHAWAPSGAPWTAAAGARPGRASRGARPPASPGRSRLSS